MPRHLALPIKVTQAGHLAHVEQDSVEDISQSVALLVDTRPGERRSVPDYGIPDPLFGGLDPAEASRVVLEWEPRADQAFVDKLLAGVVDQAEIHAGTLPATAAAAAAGDEEG